MTVRILILLLLLLLPLQSSADRDDHIDARRLLESGEILPLTVILERARAAQPGRVVEVELKRERAAWHYELEVLAADGRVWELLLDARTGELLKRELDD